MLTNAQTHRHIRLTQAGQTVELTVRPIRPEDAPALQEHHHRLSSESSFYRFHGFKKDLSAEEAAWLCRVDDYQASVVAVRSYSDQSDEIEGVAHYYRTAPGVAEVAVVVRESYQGHGLGTALLEELVKIARRNNIQYFDALVLAENWHAHHLLHTLHYPITTQVSGPIVAVRVHLPNS